MRLLTPMHRGTDGSTSPSHASARARARLDGFERQTRLDSAAAHEWPSVRSSKGQDARAHATLSPQSPSVGSGVVAPHDLDRGWVQARLGGPSVSEPSAARAETGTLMASAIAHEWQSALAVKVGRMPKPAPSSVTIPVSWITCTGLARLGSGRASYRLACPNVSGPLVSRAGTGILPSWCRRP